MIPRCHVLLFLLISLPAFAQPKLIDAHMHYNGDSAFLKQLIAKLDSLDGMAFLLTDPKDLDIIIAEATCRFLAPAYYGMELVGEVAPTHPLGRTSFTLLYRFQDSKTRLPTAIGRTVVVCYDYERRSKKEIPPERRRSMERDAVDPATAGWH